MFPNYLSRFLLYLVRGPEESVRPDLSDRERWLLWAASKNGGAINTYSGVAGAPDGYEIVIGTYSTADITSPDLIQEDHVGLMRMEALGLLKRISNTTIILTDKGRVRAKKFSF